MHPAVIRVCSLPLRSRILSAAGDAAGCREDLDEAWEIADRGSMKLHLADVHLCRARFFRDREALETAAALIADTGYHRRDEELAAARRLLDDEATR
jgi:hypothetical protein